MESTKENIKCEKNGVTKFFSTKQLEHIGKGPDGKYDGWEPTAAKPPGIPDTVVIGGSDDKSSGYDPNGGTEVTYVQSGSGDAASTADPNAVDGDAGDSAPKGDDQTGDAGNANSGDATQTGDNSSANSGDATQQNDGGDAGSGDQSQTGDTNSGDGTTATNEGNKSTDAEKVEKPGNKRPGPKPKAAGKPQE